jgi:hypothetical protein
MESNPNGSDTVAAFKVARDKCAAELNHFLVDTETRAATLSLVNACLRVSFGVGAVGKYLEGPEFIALALFI